MHAPRMSPEQAERIRRWHDNAYAASKARQQQVFDYLGRTIEVPPQVQPIVGMSHLLGEAVLAEVRPEDRVLDMGTGSGVNAVLAASQSRDVLAVDVNPVAVETARRNAERNGVGDRIEVRRSDVFSAVDGRFDLIVFDPPFRWFAPRDAVEAATTDADYRAMTEFFREADEHLTDRGRMLIFFGTSGDLAYLRELAAGFGSEVVAEQSLANDGWQVDYFTFRLTPSTRSR